MTAIIGPRPSLVPHVVRLGVSGAALVALASCVFLAGVHVDDGYLVNQVSGVWMALAMYLNEGVLYPPLFDGTAFGGTRHMPLQFVLHAGLARLTGDYLVAGKVLAYAVAALLAAALWTVFRRQMGAPAWLAVGLLACVFMTPVGQLGSLSIRGHALPVLLQVTGLALVARRATPRAAVVAGLLFALALLTKLTAVWGVLACVAWLSLRRGRLAATVAVVYGVCTLAGLAAAELLSGGRFSENLLGLSASAFEESPLLLIAGAARKLFALSATAAEATWLLAPLAVTGLVVGLRRRDVSVYQVALVAAAGITAVIMADAGAGDSHLLDLHVLVAVLAAQVWRDHVGQGGGERAFVAPLLAVAVALGIASSYGTQLADRTREAALVALGREPNRFALDEIRTLVPPGASVLSEDATVPIVLGQLPVVLDPFMLVRISRTHPAWVRTLELRIAAGEFDRVVLFRRLGFPLDGDHPFWRDMHFGADVVEAIAGGYREAHATGGYSIFLRRAG